MPDNSPSIRERRSRPGWRTAWPWHWRRSSSIRRCSVSPTCRSSRSPPTCRRPADHCRHVPRRPRVPGDCTVDLSPAAAFFEQAFAAAQENGDVRSVQVLATLELVMRRSLGPLRRAFVRGDGVVAVPFFLFGRLAGGRWSVSARSPSRPEARRVRPHRSPPRSDTGVVERPGADHKHGPGPSTCCRERSRTTERCRHRLRAGSGLARRPEHRALARDRGTVPAVEISVEIVRSESVPTARAHGAWAPQRDETVTRPVEGSTVTVAPSGMCGGGGGDAEHGGDAVLAADQGGVAHEPAALGDEGAGDRHDRFVGRGGVGGDEDVAVRSRSRASSASAATQARPVYGGRCRCRRRRRSTPGLRGGTPTPTPRARAARGWRRGVRPWRRGTGSGPAAGPRRRRASPARRRLRRRCRGRPGRRRRRGASGRRRARRRSRLHRGP